MKILIAGGQCGITMLRAKELIEDTFINNNLTCYVEIQDLWQSTYVKPGYDLIIEMFPFFDNAECKVISGKPFISRIGEKQLVSNIISFANENVI